jgi:hypothetical protein
MTKDLPMIGAELHHISVIVLSTNDKTNDQQLTKHDQTITKIKKREKETKTKQSKQKQFK